MSASKIFTGFRLGLRQHVEFNNNLARHFSSKAKVAATAIPQVKGRRLITLIPGDGVGPELAYSVQEVFKTCGIPVDFTEIFVSEIHHSRSASLEDVVDRIKSTGGVALKGSIQTGYSSHTGELQSLNMLLKRRLDLFASVVQIKTMKGIVTKHKDLDFVIIREQTEGEYSALEHESVPGVVESLKIMTRLKCFRVAKFAFDYATKHNRKKVTAVHKANIMKLGDGLFLKCCDEVSKLYPKLKFDNLIIDNCCMQLVSKPQQFDVLVMPNLYGNIVDNLAAGLVGGAGIVTGESFGSDCVVFEPGARHSFHEAMGRDIANPTATLLCAANMLYHVHLVEHSRALRRAVEKVVADAKVKTKDLGGHASTSEFTSAVISNYQM